MSRYNFVVLLLLMGLISFAFSKNSVGAILTGDTPSFQTYGLAFKDSNTKADPSYQLKNIPPVHSQDGLPVCCSVAARTLYLQDACRKNNLDCTKLPESQIPSVLSMAALAAEGKNAKLKPNNPIPIDTVKNLEDNFTSLNEATIIKTESCYPFDQFVKHYSCAEASENSKLQKDCEKNPLGDSKPVVEAKETRRIFEQIRASYEKGRTEAGYGCLECLQKELKADFGIAKNIDDIRAAMAENTFDQFINLILVGKCKSEISFSLEKNSLWPTVKSNLPQAPSDSITKIKQLLKSNTAVGLTLCPYDTPSGNLDNCKGKSHCVVIVGSKKVCNGSDCHQMLQVHNSWGKDWQEENNDGWVDADILLAHADVGRSSQLLYFDPPAK